MNHNPLMEDERAWGVQHKVLADTYNDSKIITVLLSRLCEARAEKYEFAAQQLDLAADDRHQCARELQDDGYAAAARDMNEHGDWLRERAAELRRLAK